MKNYHLIGIGGIGMSGLARILAESQVAVSGSDAKSGDMVANLQKIGIPVSIGHDPKNVPENAHVVYSSDISHFNPELVHAKEYQLPTLHRSELLHHLMQDTKSLLVTGTHGKTTTSSLLTTVLVHAGWDPTYAIGGVLQSTGVNASKGNGTYFIAEADESDGSFLNYSPFAGIITNIDYDHMNHYKLEENLLSAFKEFASKTSKHLFFCNEDRLVKLCRFEGVGYGFTEGSELKGSRFRQQGWSLLFDAEFENQKYSDIEVALTGYHNALNALAVFGLCLKLGVPEPAIREAFKSFCGVKRRCELKGEIQAIMVRDDYGHHPTEVQATLKGIKQSSESRRLVVLFQPHRYSRIKDCMGHFQKCFDEADLVLVTDIYAAGEKPEEGIHAENIVKEVQSISSVPIIYVPKEKLLEHTLQSIRPLDIVVTMGAGDIWQTGEELLIQLKDMPQKKIRLGVVFGGRSEEHDISIKSAENILKGFDRSIFEITPFYISKHGRWHQSDELRTQGSALTLAVLSSLNACDAIFPVMHGTNGEDGTLQGFFDILDLPYAGCNHQASAVCMDKAVTKKVAEAAGLSTAPFLDFSLWQWSHDQELVLRAIQADLRFPLYVKPVHLGSTIGVKRVTSEQDLRNAVEAAFLVDNHVLVEQEIKGREIEFAVLGNRNIVVYPPGEICSEGAVYDFEAKYGANGFKTTSQADMDPSALKKGMDFAKAAYISAGCDGFARVDCFLDETGKFFLNEINPIPGFTEISLYPQMCEKNGLKLSSLLTELVCLGLSRHRQRWRLSG